MKQFLAHLFARFLSKKGHRDRKSASRKVYQETHDDLRRRLNLPPIKWRRAG